MQTVLTIVSLLLILAVFLSLIRNDYWVFKILEYPRLQKLVLVVIVAACWLFFWPPGGFQLAVFGGLIVSIFYLIYKIWPYTPFFKEEMKRVSSGDPNNELKLYSLNVYQENRRYADLLRQVRSVDPDIIFLIETDKAWADAVAGLEKDYPYKILSPLENTYGLLLYSRLEFDTAKLVFQVKNDVPSIDVVVKLPSGRKVQLWGLHPEPPVPGENLYSTAKDKELMKIALKAKAADLPVVVFGDLNDVAWSHTTTLFRKTSELLDPRRGRGFYSTFSARNWFIRFPLDYVFCSSEFGLVRMKRLPGIGSDHFSTLTHLALRNDIEEKQSPPRADEAELQEVREIAKQPV